MCKASNVSYVESGQLASIFYWLVTAAPAAGRGPTAVPVLIGSPLGGPLVS
jgi:hypothetical protein